MDGASPADALEAVRAQLLASIPAWWGDLSTLLDQILPQPLEPTSLIPMAICEALGGQRADGVSVTVAWTLIGASVRILDDCADADNPTSLEAAIGMGRALNIGTALMTLATGQLMVLPIPTDRRERIMSLYLSTSMRVWYGQEMDLRGDVQTLEAYLKIAEDKTGVAFGAACGFGALCATGDPEAVAAAYQCGFDLGMMFQLLDDIEACWFPDGPSDWQIGKHTYPVLAAIERSEVYQPELVALMAQADRIASEPRLLEILDAMDMRRHTLWAALTCRSRAVKHLAPHGDPAQRQLLDGILQWVSRDLDAWATQGDPAVRGPTP